ncbi:MFS transporter [Marinomonas fungiae]|uniref:MFS transporter n=1 Tax=Marinomonas fungiae TaxID=1137284 RepID=UPI003A8DDB20
MRMPITFGFSQIVSNGFGLYLFAALVPLMQSSIDISAWFLAIVGACTQVAYLSGAMLVGTYGQRFDSGKVLMISMVVTSAMLFIMASQNDQAVILVALVVLAVNAAICWGCIVELVTRYGLVGRTATNLSFIASGSAWGYGVNGALILMFIPLFGWRSAWALGGVLGILALLTIIVLLKRLQSSEEKTDRIPGDVLAMGVKQLMRTVFKERPAFLSCLIFFAVGFATIPFSTWLNLYLAELSLPSALGGYTWSMIGLSGMVSGLLAGKLSDYKGHGIALLVMFLGFALCITAFTYDPSRFVLVAGFGYGLMYFAIWGVISGWLNKQYSSKVTMQINGIGMVVFGTGGALGNLLAGAILEFTGSLSTMYGLIAVISVLLAALATYIYMKERTPDEPFVGAF